MRNLLFLSLIIIFLSGCAAARTGNISKTDPASFSQSGRQSPFLSGFEKSMFRTSIDIHHVRLSGITVIKKTSDTSIRVIMSSEIGLTFFDLEYRSGKFIPHYLFGPLKKPSLVKVLDGSFRALFFSQVNPKEALPFMDNQSGTIKFSFPAKRFFMTVSPMSP